MRFRKQLAKERTRTMDRLIKISEYIRMASKDTLKALREMAKDPLIYPVIKTLISVPGVAFITAMTFNITA